MSLTIDKLSTRCQVPSRLDVPAQLVDRVARERFAAECVRQLSSRWTLQQGIIRIRRLAVRLRLSPTRFDGDLLARAWADAFTRELVTALSYPAGGGSAEIVRAESRAAWVAMVVSDLMRGVACGRWEYEEFQNLFALSTPEAILALLADEPSEIVPTLLALEKRGVLDRVLSLMDELALERIFNAISRGTVGTHVIIRVADLLAIGRFALDNASLIKGPALANRRNALRLFVSLVGQSHAKSGSVWSVRQILQALTTLAILVEALHTAGPSRWARELSAETLRTRIGGQLSPAVSELFDEIHGLADSSHVRPKNGAAVNIAELVDLITDLKPLVASASDMDSEGRLLSSDCAGVLLLAAIVNRLGWPERIIGSVLGSAYGQRAVTYCLAGIGQAVIGRFDEEPRSIDPGLALFSGWLEEADLGALRRFFASASREDRRQLLGALLPQADSLDEHSSSWAATFDRLTDQLIREFASRVRGFKQSSRPFVVKNFLALSGRIRVEDTRIAVTLASTPFHTAIHISGMDEPVEYLSWLGARRLEFQLEGL